jgi:hypothetical protein
MRAKAILHRRMGRGLLKTGRSRASIHRSRRDLARYSAKLTRQNLPLRPSGLGKIGGNQSVPRYILMACTLLVSSTEALPPGKSAA